MKIIVFPSVQHVLMGESALKIFNLEFEIIPLANYIHQGCGLGIRVQDQLLQSALECFTSKNIIYDKVIDCR